MPSSKKRKRLSQEEAELSRPAKQLRRNESNEEEGEEEEEEELEFAAFDGDSDDGDDDNNPVDEELDDSADLEEEEDDGEPSAPDDRFTATFDEINPEYLTSAEPSGADSTIRQNYFRLQVRFSPKTLNTILSSVHLFFLVTAKFINFFFWSSELCFGLLLDQFSYSTHILMCPHLLV